MTRVGKKSKFTLSKFLGVVVMPLLAGALLGYTAAYFLYSGLINNIEQECFHPSDILIGQAVGDGFQIDIGHREDSSLVCKNKSAFCH